MGKLDIKESQVINTSADKVWEILGPNFLRISEWGGGILSSVDNPQVKKRFESAPAGGRICNVKGFGQFKETILHYSDEQREITWDAVSDKIPGFLTGLQNAFKIEAIDEKNSKITSNLTADLKGIGGFFLGGKIKKDFSKTIKFFLNDLKIYAETGNISEKKKRELAK